MRLTGGSRRTLPPAVRGDSGGGPGRRRAALAGSALKRALLAAAAVSAAALFWAVPARVAHGTPLWAGARFTREDRDRAVQRGLLFLYGLARDPKAFAEWGSDLVGMFGNIAATSSNRELRQMAWSMGHERALEWRRLHAHIPADVDAAEVADLLFGSDAAERLGVPDQRMWRELRDAAARFPAVDYYGFDPAVEAPPNDIPEECRHCSARNVRGSRRCVLCGGTLTFRSRYDVWQDALIGTYTGDRYGVTLGGHLVDVLHWVGAMRPYPGPGEREFYEATYGITHLVYVLNDYSLNRLSADCLPEEFAFLRANLRVWVAGGDPETVGEHLDTLGAFGLTLGDAEMRSGFDYLLAAQGPDGSWGDRETSDVYRRYHPTWTAIDGLREYRWTKVLPCLAR